jgi:hypothetical protein
MAGFGLNLKLVLYLQSQCLTESLGFLNPPHRQAAKRQAVKKPSFLSKNLLSSINTFVLSHAKF